MRCKNVFFIFLLSIIACKTKDLQITSEMISSNSSKDFTSFTIFNVGQAIPEGSDYKGSIKFNNTLFFNECGFENLIAQLKQEVSKAGGNMLKLEKYRPINGNGKGCHKVKASIYSINDSIRKKSDPLLMTNKLYIYRYFGGILTSSKIVINDSIKYKIDSNDDYFFVLDNDIENKIYFEKEDSTITIPKGTKKDHYLRIGLNFKLIGNKQNMYYGSSKIDSLEYWLFKKNRKL